jgi:exoribonuclease R
MPAIPAVLVLEGRRTYGKWKRRKSLFKCVPDDKRMPIFLVPYVIKNTFNKRIFNKYTVIKFLSWEGNHPIGTIVQTIGNVNQLDNFYEYQLYCKSLYASIQDFKKETMKKIKQQTEEEFIDTISSKYNPIDRRDRDIFTIDPLTSKDFDDALGIEKNDPTTTLSIYIANVPFWMDALNLWESFSERISTIYLPDRKRPMLPTVLSDALCSLQENRPRFAFTVDVTFDNKTYEIININWCNTLIRVSHNLRYDTKQQENYPAFISLISFIKKVNQKYKYVDNIRNCHDVVAYCMILMNYLSAKKLLKFKTGIFRGVELNKSFTPPGDVPDNIKNFLKMWNSFGANYAKFENLKSHEALDLDAYVHVTSPIRRLVDILTMILLQEKLGLVTYSETKNIFYDKWTSDEALDYINKTMRSIRKVQNDCSLLKICCDDAETLDKIYPGYIFDKIQRNDKLYQYMVYLPELKTVNRFTSRYSKENMSQQRFKLYVFMDENQLKQKLRIELLDK